MRSSSTVNASGALRARHNRIGASWALWAGNY